MALIIIKYFIFLFVFPLKFAIAYDYSELLVHLELDEPVSSTAFTGLAGGNGSSSVFDVSIETRTVMFWFKANSNGETQMLYD